MDEQPKTPQDPMETEEEKLELKVETEKTESQKIQALRNSIESVEVAQDNKLKRSFINEEEQKKNGKTLTTLLVLFMVACTGVWFSLNSNNPMVFGIPEVPSEDPAIPKVVHHLKDSDSLDHKKLLEIAKKEGVNIEESEIRSSQYAEQSKITDKKDIQQFLSEGITEEILTKRTQKRAETILNKAKNKDKESAELVKVAVENFKKSFASEEDFKNYLEVSKQPVEKVSLEAMLLLDESLKLDEEIRK